MTLHRWFKLRDGTLARPRKESRLDGRAVVQVLLRLPDGSERVECWFASELDRRILSVPEVADFRAWKLANLRLRISTPNVKAERAEARRRIKRAGWRASQPKSKVA